VYALAASAAGVSLLALVQPAEARIVYTRTHEVIGTNGVYNLDLNHDGTIDFLLQETGIPPPGSQWSNALRTKEAFGNAVQGGNFLASALKKGAPIGPHQAFLSGSRSYGEFMVGAGCSELGCSTNGPWLNVKNRYLGLKFRIDGIIHYGWARLSVDVQAPLITATLTGYAYETIPGKGIRAGQSLSAATAGPGPRGREGVELADATTNTKLHEAQPGSLGWLALGAHGLARWRRP
jgi:hypothetical protein